MLKNEVEKVKGAIKKGKRRTELEKAKKGGRKNRKLGNMKADVKRDEIMTAETMMLQSSDSRGKRSALPLNKILRASRKALTGASEYYDKIQGPIIFYIKAAVMEDWQIPDDSKK